MAASSIQTDVLVVGGGLVGTAMCAALAELSLDVVLLEVRDPGVFEQPGFDTRVTALANGSRRILEALGVWPALAGELAAIRRIHISERGRLGMSRIEAVEEGVAALGYTVENRILGQALWHKVAGSASLQVIAPAGFVGLSTDADGVTVTVAGSSRTDSVRARLLIAADGVNSPVRMALAIGAERRDYGQSALVFNCEPGEDLAGLAYERFTPQGPLAVLPLPRQRAGIVWTQETAAVEALREADDTVIRAGLSAALGARIDPIGRIGRRGIYPLQLVRSERIVGPRVALIGSAGVNLHPVAGQGFNLAMRDIAGLAEVIADALAAAEDPGSEAVLGRFRDWRRRDQDSITGITHALVSLFGLPLVGPLRSAGLALFDVMPAAKSAFARHAMGRSGRQPRLACGRALRES